MTEPDSRSDAGPWSPGDPWPWTPGSATGIGSLPGRDILEAVKTVLGELPDLPYLPELPARGPGADMVGRSAGLLVDMPVELYAGRWRTAAHGGVDLRRVRDIWERDLDALTDGAADFDGPLKVQAAGPWTLAASLDLPIGGRMLRDAGAVRDLTASLAEGIAAHVAELRTRLPHARLLVQLDEPSLPAVLAGRVPTESGYGMLAAIEDTVVTAALADVVSAAGVPVVVHCCAADAPIDLFRAVGACAVAIDLDLVRDLDPLAEALDSGLGLFAGAVSTDPNAADPSSAAVADRIKRLWHTLGFATNQLPDQVVVTPACGLAELSMVRAQKVTTACREAGRRLSDG
ncbi:MAG TPA: methionine synthase [Micromonosporaceae bacterium]|nr:methionine synthase [Micromonosporaceae bacterium]